MPATGIKQSAYKLPQEIGGVAGRTAPSCLPGSSQHRYETAARVREEVRFTSGAVIFGGFNWILGPSHPGDTMRGVHPGQYKHEGRFNPAHRQRRVRQHTGQPGNLPDPARSAGLSNTRQCRNDGPREEHCHVHASPCRRRARRLRLLFYRPPWRRK